MLQLALELARMGFRVFPLRPGGKDPACPGGFHKATNDPHEIARLWERWGSDTSNVGIRTGWDEEVDWGFLVVDIDSRADGFTSLSELEIRNEPLPHTLTCATGGDGQHRFLEIPGPFKSTTITGGVELKADGAYVVAAGSIHPSGKPYRWEDSLQPIAMAPQWILEQKRSQHAPMEFDHEITEGGRHDFITSITGTMRRRGVTLEGAIALMIVENQIRCKPPLTDDQVKETVEGIYSRYEAENPYQTTEYEPMSNPSGKNDAGNAARMALHFGHKIRRLGTHNQWLIWNGQRWEVDHKASIEHHAKMTARTILREAASLKDEKAAESLRKWGLHSLDQSRINAMVRSLVSEPGISVIQSELDRDPNLLNCQNGTLDLNTFELKPYEPRNLITKITAADYVPNARSLTFDRFLKESTSLHPDVLPFLQVLAGHSLLAKNSQEIIIFLLGGAGSGKSTLLGAMTAALGSYATGASINSFLAGDFAQSGGAPRGDLASLAGVRFVSATEPDPTRKLDISNIKALTGGDTITVRHLYGHPFEMKPTFTPWIGANDPPRVDDVDAGIWRRLLRVPMENARPLEMRNDRIKEELINPRISGEAVLAWMVKGLMRYREEGFIIPDIVLQRTEELREEMDPITDFLETECEFVANSKISLDDLYRAYSDWAKQNGIRYPLSPKSFNTRIERHGAEKKRENKGRVWLGLTLKPNSRYGFRVIFQSGGIPGGGGM